jgi:hypothetical protein
MRLLIPIVGLLAGAVVLAVPAASPAASKSSSRKKTTRRRAPPKAPAVSAKTRADANRQVLDYLARALEYPPENPAALIPFFERLYRHERGEAAEPVRILHFGDSHTAADEWTGALRALFQQQFGDGGAGFSFAGKPDRTGWAASASGPVCRARRSSWLPAAATSKSSSCASPAAEA